VSALKRPGYAFYALDEFFRSLFSRAAERQQDAALPIAEKPKMLKNSSFVSGHRFSDAAICLSSHAPLGAGHRKGSFSAICLGSERSLVYSLGLLRWLLL